MNQSVSKILDFGSKTYVMGIMNVTPDSFSGDGLLGDENFIEAAIRKAHTFIQKGVDILDIGGESTRPGALPVSTEEEVSRILPVIKAIRQTYDIPLSIDTTKAVVAEAALSAGATLINDVSGLMLDPKMIDVALKFNAYVVLMHSPNSYPLGHRDKGKRFLEDKTLNVIAEVKTDLEKLVSLVLRQGIKKENIILDPGIGFGKTVAQNLSLIKGLSSLKKLGYPVLLGASRKSFIGYTTGAPVKNRLSGSLAVAVLGVMQGVDILRVHDVEATKQAVIITDAIHKAL